MRIPIAWLALWLGAFLTLPGCTSEPLDADPALWLVRGEDGSKAWLFGTIHSSPSPIAWRTAKVGQALDEADVIIVEVAQVADPRAMAKTFAAMSQSPGLPPLTQRVPPAERGKVEHALAKHGLAEAGFAQVETWAAALTLARAAASESDAGNGVDRAILAYAKGKPVIELEGTSGQLRIFDTLPESEQADMLLAIATDAGNPEDGPELAKAWRAGDMATIERETQRGLLADPELRAALFTDRNHRWAARIAGELAIGRRPFVAVGAAHMAGPDGLPALLGQKGYVVTRIR